MVGKCWRAHPFDEGGFSSFTLGVIPRGHSHVPRFGSHAISPLEIPHAVVKSLHVFFFNALASMQYWPVLQYVLLSQADEHGVHPPPSLQGPATIVPSLIFCSPALQHDPGSNASTPEVKSVRKRLSTKMDKGHCWQYSASIWRGVKCPRIVYVNPILSISG